MLVGYASRMTGTGSELHGRVCSTADHGLRLPSFVGTSDPTSKIFGIGLGFAILLGMLLVGLVIASAIMELLFEQSIVDARLDETG